MSKPSKPNHHRPAGESVASKRRLALKTVGGGALVSGLLDRLPHTWQSPLVDSAVLPAHAQTSFTLGQFTFRYITTADGARRDLLTPYRITPLPDDVASQAPNYLLSIDPGGSTQFVQAEPQGLDHLIPAALAQGFPIGLSVAEAFNLQFGIEHTVNTPAFGYLMLSDGQGMCRFPISAWLDSNGAPQFAGGRDIHSAVGEPCGPPGDNRMFYAGAGFLNDQARLGAVPTAPPPTVPEIQFALTGFPHSNGQDYRGNEGDELQIRLVAFGLMRAQDVWVRGIIRESSADGRVDVGDYTVPEARHEQVGDHIRFRIRIEPAGSISMGESGLALAMDDNSEEGIETLVLEIEPSLAYRVGDRYRSRVDIYEEGVPLPTTAAPAVETAPPTQPPPPPVVTTPAVVVEGQIGLTVMDAGGNELATMMFDYAVQRDSARRIDYMRFPATAVQTAMHQPASRVLEILFPTALAQANELHLAEEVELDFTDDVLIKTAMLVLRYDDAPCSGTFDVEVELYSGRMGIREISGSSMISDCGSVNVTVAEDSGFGTFAPPPTPGPTEPGPTATTAAPLVSITTTMPPTRVQFTSSQLNVMEGDSVVVEFTVTGDSAITFDMLLADGGSGSNEDLEAPATPEGAGFDDSGSNYNITGITIPAGTGTRTTSITLNALDERIVEGDEMLVFQLANARDASDGQQVAFGANNMLTLTINDISLPTTERLTLVEFQATGLTATEGQNTLMTLIKTGPGMSDITVDVVLLSSSTATAADLSSSSVTTPAGLMLDQTGDRYVFTITIPEAESFVIIPVGILADTETETGDQLVFELQNPRSPSADQYIGLGEKTQLTIDIVESDKPTIQFAESEGYTVLEGGRIELRFQIDNGPRSGDEANIRFVVSASPMLTAPDDIDIELGVSGTLRDRYEDEGKIGVGFHHGNYDISDDLLNGIANTSGRIAVVPMNDFVFDEEKTITFSLLPTDKLDGRATDHMLYDPVEDPDYYDNTRYHIGGRSSVTVTIVDAGTTVAPRSFTYSGTIDHQFSGTFTLKPDAPATGTINEDHLASHTLTVFNALNSSTVDFELDLVNGMLTIMSTLGGDGTAASVTVRHDFQYTIGESTFLGTRTADDPAETTSLSVTIDSEGPSGTTGERYGIRYFNDGSGSGSGWDLQHGDSTTAFNVAALNTVTITSS